MHIGNRFNIFPFLDCNFYRYHIELVLISCVETARIFCHYRDETLK